MFGSFLASRLVDELFLTVSPFQRFPAPPETLRPRRARPRRTRHYHAARPRRGTGRRPADAAGRPTSLGAGARLAPLPPLRVSLAAAVELPVEAVDQRRHRLEPLGDQPQA